MKYKNGSGSTMYAPLFSSYSGPTLFAINIYPMIIEFLKTTSIFLLIIGLIIVGGVAIVRSINYIEENTYAVKDTIQRIVYTVMALHVYMLYMGMGIFHALFSLSIQYAFHCFFDVYPVIKPEDPKFIYGVLGSLVNHFLLIRMFINNSSGFLTVVLCFILIWTTPFCFFFTMSASEDTLFLKQNGKGTKTYLSIAIDWLWNVGRGRGKTLDSICKPSMDKAIFELAEKLHHPSDIGTKLDTVERTVKEQYEEHEDAFKRKLMLGYEHVDDITHRIDDLSKQFSEFKIVEAKSVEILRNFTSLVKDYKTVKAMCKAHQRFVKVKEFVESLQTVDEECECEDIGEYHSRIYKKEEFMFELLMYNDGVSPENFARVQHAASTIQRQAADFKTILIEMVSDLQACKDQEGKLNEIIEREEKRDELTRLAQEGERGQDPELQALAVMYPQYLTRKPKELKKCLVSALHGAIESKFMEIDTTNAFVGRLAFVLEDLEFINKNVRLTIFPFDDALMAYHKNLKALVDRRIDQLDAGEILSLIEYKMDYYNKIEASYGRVGEALGPNLVQNEAELLDKYAATATSKLQEWIENITTTEVDKFIARESGITKDEEDKLISSGFIRLLQLIKVQLEPISFNKKVFLHIAQAVRKNCTTFRDKIVSAMERDFPQACAGKGKPGYEDYCIMFGNSGLRLTQYITSLPECQSSEIKQLGNIFIEILRASNHFLAEFIISTCSPAIKRFFTDDWRDGMRTFMITIEDFLQDYENIMSDFSFTTFITELSVSIVGAYGKRLRSKTLQLCPEYGKILKGDHSSLLGMLSIYGDKEGLTEALRPLLRLSYILESTSDEVIVSEASSLKFYESPIGCDTLCNIISSRDDLSEDIQKTATEGIRRVFKNKKKKHEKKRSFMPRFLSRG